MICRYARMQAKNHFTSLQAATNDGKIVAVLECHSSYHQFANLRFSN